MGAEGLDKEGLKLVSGCRAKCEKKQKKLNDQRAPVTRYFQIKELRSLDMKYYPVPGGLLPLVEPYDNMKYQNNREISFVWIPPELALQYLLLPSHVIQHII